MNPILHSMAAAGASGAATMAVLLAAPVQAAPLCGNSPVSFAAVFAPGFSCQVGNAVVDLFNTSFVTPVGTTSTVAFAFFDDIYDVDFNFNPANSFNPTAGFGYRFTLLNANEVVVGSALDVNGNGVRPRPGQTDPGTYLGIAQILDPSFNTVLTLTSEDGERDPTGVDFTPLPPLNSLFVAQGVGTDPQLPSGIRPTINNVSNQFITEVQPSEVPGPLGIAGVGAMFATARRLRRRIGAAA